MAKKKKNKQRQSQAHNMAVLNTKTHIDKTYAAVQKIIRVYGGDPDLLKALTKHQRRFLLFLRAEAPRFKVEEGSYVPRHLINFISETVHRIMRMRYLGDESIGLTYLELATYGVAFSSIILAAAEAGESYFSPEQLKAIRLLAPCFENERVRQDLVYIGGFIHDLVMMLSKLNFRIYGYHWVITEPETGTMRSTVFISSEETQSIHFVHKQKERIAFRVCLGRINGRPAKTITIDRNLIFPHKKSFHSVPLEIYIQSHALQRAKERIDIFSAHIRNRYVMESLIYQHLISNTVSGSPMLECGFRHMGLGIIIRFGYFPFIIRDNKLIVMTFLPLTSPDTSEGAYFQEHFGLQTEDIKFLGMDKLSFFFTVDFEQIPSLKEALIATNIQNMITHIKEGMDLDFSIDQKKTMMVKKFFEEKINDEAETVYPETEL
ncbi:MAG: hypothetical protein LBG80_14855 [Bacteroidales bacterium]|jgi:hypothetical protein|nr:hypothetical protein [Bacteroidales bacterium]